MNIRNTYFLLFMPSICCVLLLYFIHDKLEVYPLSFGVIIGIANWFIRKYNRILNLVLSILISYFAYFSGIAFWALIVFLFKERLELSGEIWSKAVYAVSAFIISPLVLITLYQRIFKTDTALRKKIPVVLGTIIVLNVIYWFTFENDVTTINKFDLMNPYILWQPITALGLQLTLYQKRR